MSYIPNVLDKQHWNAGVSQFFEQIFFKRPYESIKILYSGQRHCFFIPTRSIIMPTSPQRSTVVGTIPTGSHKRHVSLSFSCNSSIK